MKRVGAVVAVAVLVSGAWTSAFAQSVTADTPAPNTSAGVDVSRLPINLDRIQRELRESTIREERDGLNISYVIGVFGQAPALEFFTADDNLVTGPVPYGAPTHQEILEHLTPMEYRAPAADLSALLRWLAERAKK
jgi:hypothetical protein